MGDAADQLRQEIDAKRQDATDKIEQLEQKVTGMADQVQGQVEQVRDQVMQTFDWRKQVDERPLVALGAAFIGGVVLSSVLSGDDDRHGSGSAPRYSGNTVQYGMRGSGGASAGAGMGIMASVRNAAKSTGFEDTLNNMTTSLMSTLTERIKEVADQTFPGMGEKLQNAAKQGTFGDAIAEQAKSASGSSSSMSTGTPPSASDYARGGELSSSTANG
jgi:hypothetical protein